MSMDIYAKRGHKVRFIGAHETQERFVGLTVGSHDVLTKGEVHTVDNTDVHSCHTLVRLVGEDGTFNSVCFEDVDNETTQQS